MKSRSLFLVAVSLVLAAASGTPASLAAPPPATALVATLAAAPAAALATPDYATDASRAVNRQRHAHGVRKLKRVTCLERQARARVAVMARTGRLAHARLEPVLSACGLRRAAENIADGFASGRAAVDLGWMRSTPHRRNLLSTAYRTMGVAAARDATGTWYVSLVVAR